MNHASTRLKVLSIGVVSVLGFAACGSDEDSSSGAATPPSVEVTLPDVSIPDISIPDVTLPAGVTLPDGVTIPAGAGLSEQCTQYAQLFASAFAGQSSAFTGLDGAVEDLQAQVPDDLKDDVAVVATALSGLVDLAKEYEGNPSGLYADPEALALFGDPAFVNSSQAVSNWLETECGVAG